MQWEPILLFQKENLNQSQLRLSDDTVKIHFISEFFLDTRTWLVGIVSAIKSALRTPRPYQKFGIQSASD